MGDSNKKRKFPRCTASFKRDFLQNFDFALRKKKKRFIDNASVCKSARPRYAGEYVDVANRAAMLFFDLSECALGCARIAAQRSEINLETQLRGAWVYAWAGARACVSIGRLESNVSVVENVDAVPRVAPDVSAHRRVRATICSRIRTESSGNRRQSRRRGFSSPYAYAYRLSCVTERESRDEFERRGRRVALGIVHPPAPVKIDSDGGGSGVAREC